MSHRGPRGWVMMMVLLVLVMLSLLVTGFYVISTDAATMSRVMVHQQVAMSHADVGLQEGIRAVRSQQIDLAPITAFCTSAEVDANTCTAMVSIATVDNGGALDIGANGGLQYRWVIYRRPVTDDPGQPTNRFVIRSTGFAGYTLNSTNLVTSIVEAEVDVGRGTHFVCTGGYECQ